MVYAEPLTAPCGSSTNFFAAGVSESKHAGLLMSVNVEYAGRTTPALLWPNHIAEAA